MQTFEFNQEPSVGPSFFKALFLPRKGLDKNNPQLPEIQVRLNQISLDKAKFESYREVCQLHSSELPLLYPHIPASSSHMFLLTHKQFPLKLLGAVHLRNQITQHESIQLDDKLDIEIGFTDIRITSKGVEFEFETKVQVKGKLVWEELTTYFKRGRFGKPNHEPITTLETLTNTKEIAQWHLSPKLGKQYAKICNDYNPIHASKTLAKLFGFKRDVAHGLGVLATAMDRIALKASYNDVFFKGPLFLDSPVKLLQGVEQPERFDLYCGKNDRPSLCFVLGSSK